MARYVKLPSGNKPLPELMLTHIYVNKWHHQATMRVASENIFRLQCKHGSSKWASPHHKQFATFLHNFYIFMQLLWNFEIWASVRRTWRTRFSDALELTKALSLIWWYKSYRIWLWWVMMSGELILSLIHVIQATLFTFQYIIQCCI